jgi:anaerobic selenocysteine-containing dehydrogenase
MASEERTLLAQMQAKIAQVEKTAQELNALGQGVPVVEKNTRSILTAAALLEFGISDVAEIETQSRRTAVGEVKKIKTVCRSCHGGCGVIAHVQDGKVIKVEGNRDSPISHGTLCSKGLAITQLAYHPDRILHPMKKTRAGWQQITWDESLDTIVTRFKVVIKDYGPESIVIGQGTGRDYESHLYRFANQLGTPNVLTAGHMCYVSRVASTLVTVGNLPICDYAGGPKCIVMWGCNPQ